MQTPAEQITDSNKRVASFQGVAVDAKRNIAEYLTFTEATRLSLASRGIHLEISAAPRLKLAAISGKFQQLIRDHPIRDIPVAQTEVAVAGHGFNLKRIFTTKASRAKEEREQQAASRDMASKQREREAALDQLVFHIASGHARDPVPGSKSKYGEVHKAMHDGNVDLVRAGLREFLGLSEHLIPKNRKLACLREANGMCSLEYFGQYPLVHLDPAVQRQCEAIFAFVDEIVSTQYLDAPEKMLLCVNPVLLRIDDSTGVEGLVKINVVRRAMSSKNPAVAAFILLGIHEAAAGVQLKHSLLGAAADSWSGVAHCVDAVIDSLRPFQDQQPNWVGDVLARLQNIKMEL